MSDLKRVILARTLNWKPSVQYWYEQYLYELAEVARLKNELIEANKQVNSLKEELIELKR